MSEPSTHRPEAEKRDPPEDLVQRFLEERRRGGRSTVEEWAARHPQHAEEIRAHFPTMELLERAGERAHSRLEASPTPARLGEYRILRELGRGGMGIVYEAIQEPLGRRVALKVLPPQATLAPQFLERFRREAHAAGRLRHPSIVPVFGVGEEKGVHFFAMQFVEGQPLDLVLRDIRRWRESSRRGADSPPDDGAATPVVLEPSPASEASFLTLSAQEGSARYYRDVARLGLHLAEALAHAHERGVLHRDIKPSNLLLDSEGRVWITDFGLCKEQGTDDLTLSGDVVGTLRYLAPERLTGHSDARADVYGLGMALYELLTLRPAFRSRDRTRLLYMVARKLPLRPRRVDPRIPTDLESIVLRAIEKHPEDRYDRAEAMAADLSAFLEGRPVSARSPGFLHLIRLAVRRNKPVAASVVLAVMALVATSVLYLVHLSRQEALARHERANVLRLSAFQVLDELVLEADAELWPPHPHLSSAYETWLQSAHALVATLGDHRAQLAALRAEALPRTEAEREAERHSHPRHEEFLRLEGKLASVERAQALRDGRIDPVEVTLDRGFLPADAETLGRLAWPLVHLDREIFGQEGRGLALARLAVAGETNNKARAWNRAVLGSALFANGRAEEALREGTRALQLAPPASRADLQVYVGRLAREIEAGEAALAELDRERDALDAELSARRTFRFASEEQRWWHNQLEKLVAQIEVFADPGTGLIDGTSPEHGWGVRRRRDWAGVVEELTVTGEGPARRWAEALGALADPDSLGLQLEPQLGLVPIGRDPASGLWEFAHPLSGRVPERDEEGRLVPTEETGLVFVLLPGGTFVRGGQASDPARPNYDPHARELEGPPQPVPLTPFFLSKYEMTQGQWLRLTGQNPSEMGPHRMVTGWNEHGRPADLSHPVERVSWSDGRRLLARSGLTLPSEAQWEYGARGGTSTIWWTGDDPRSLSGFENLSDAYAQQSEWQGMRSADWLYDGYAFHAPVATFAPNPYGLYDALGNVAELCLDDRDDAFYRRGGGVDPVNETGTAKLRVVRGGSYAYDPSHSRAAYRQGLRPDSHSSYVGLRPARAVAGPMRR